MKFRLCMWMIACLWMSTVRAQQNRFIYLQTENQQTFYVKLNNTVYSSSPSGYLIIPKLTDGRYELQIGFPRNEYPAQIVQCELAGKDGGYVLKNLGNETWGLFNLTTLELAKANPGNVSQAASPKNDDSFEGVLSNVVETDLKKKKDRNKGKDKQKAEPVTGIRILTNRTDESGLQRVYIDESEGGSDTITVFMPGRAEGVRQPNPKPAATEKPAVRFIETEAVPSKTPAAPVAMVNSDCKNLANENDFLKLRKQMAAKSAELDMIEIARKAFRKKCYNTQQLQNLIVLLTTDESRYVFLDAAYPFTSDTESFRELKALLTDPYYIQRFEAMIRQ